MDDEAISRTLTDGIRHVPGSPGSSRPAPSLPWPRPCSTP